MRCPPMLLRPTFTFIPPALPSPAECPPIGGEWIHEIKHDGYRMMVRRDVSGVRLLTRNGKDWTGRFPTIVDATAGLKARSCLIDGEAVCCDANGLAVFALLRYRQRVAALFLYAFDLLEIDGQGLRREPLETRKATARLRGHRVEAPGLAVCQRPHTALAQVQEPGSAGGEARSGGGLGQAMTKFAFGFLYLLMAHFFSTIEANAADAWREDFRRCRVLEEFSQGSVYLSANEKMVELDVQWGDGADLENLGVERRADRVISSAKCAQKKITPGP